MLKLSETCVVLERDGPYTPWGIRLVGGSDLDTPLIITKVCWFMPPYVICPKLCNTQVLLQHERS